MPKLCNFEELKEKVKCVIKNITVEPCLFLLALCMGIQMLVAQNLYIQKVCQVNLNMDHNICINITNHKDEQIMVQKNVSVLQGYNQVIQAIPSVIYTLFAGPWSDLHGRKLLIVCSTVGYVLNNAVFIINTIWFKELKAEYLLFECLQDCSGGYVVFWMACYSYISDVTTKEQRTLRIALADGLFPAGYYAGKAISGPMYDKFGFLPCFSLGFITSLLCFLYAIFILKESKEMRPKEVVGNVEETKQISPSIMEKNKYATFFDLSNFTGGFKALFKKRQNNKRSMIMMLTVSFALVVLVNRKSSFEYLYFRRHFSWSTTKYSFYSGLLGIVGMIAMYVALPFMSTKLKFHDMTISMISGVTSVLHMILLCAVPAASSSDYDYDYLIYLSGIMNFLRITQTTVTRSLVSKCVEPTEVGKVFSMFGLFQATVPLAAGPIFGTLYKSTIDHFPGAFLLMCAVIYAVVIVLNGVIYAVGKRNNDGEEKTIENLNSDEQELDDK